MTLPTGAGPRAAEYEVVAFKRLPKDASRMALRGRAPLDLESDSCGDAWPRPSLQGAGILYSGRSVRGNICLQIAKNDAPTLMLYSASINNGLVEFVGLKKVWFALR